MEHLLKQVGLDFEEFRYICHSYHHSDREEVILLAEGNNGYQSNDKLLTVSACYNGKMKKFLIK